MKHLFFTLILLFTLTSTNCAQKNNDSLYVGFWNLENLFDTIDDPRIEDEEFLPGGEKDWNDERLEKKMYNISRVIRTMNNGLGPDILGICEVENEDVLRKMVDNFLSDLKYKVVHIESLDARGIDNALIFDSTRFNLISKEGLRVDLGSGGETRLILHAALLFEGKDILHFYVNHWPSRRGGEKESEWRRVTAAKVLRNSIESLLNQNGNTKIIAIGDFNDEPNNESILNHLKAYPLICDSVDTINLQVDDKTELFNLAYQDWAKGLGSFMYQQDFNMLDQIIISRDLLVGDEINYDCNSFKVYNHQLMVTRTGKFKDAPFPTYGGRRYLGGYSDHYPVIAKFKLLRK